jgi:hypothetical protein
MQTRTPHKKGFRIWSRKAQLQVNKRWSPGSSLNLNMLSCAPWAGGPRHVQQWICGTTQWSTLLTLEDLAHRGLVEQVAFQWLEPSGWALERDTLDILNTTEITTEEIIRRVTQYVQHARLMSALWWMSASLCLAVVVLLVGLGIAWVRRGFASTVSGKHP